MMMEMEITVTLTHDRRYFKSSLNIISGFCSIFVATYIVRTKYFFSSNRIL